MNKKLFEALEALEIQNGIPKSYMIKELTRALEKAFEKEVGGKNFRIVVNEEKFELKVFKQLTIVDEVKNPITEISLEDAKRISRKHTLGGIVEIELKPNEFRRLSAGAGKQVIVQAIRDHERGRFAKSFEEKKEEIVTALVDKVDPETGNVRLELSTGNFATLLKEEQIPGETFEVGDHIKVYVIAITKDISKGPIVTLSRTHSGLVRRLFELNIPEIADGTVIIKNVAREAGSRTKISVMSRDPNVDPVGTCVGVQNQLKNIITDELKGEKIDIILYSDNIEEYVKAALAPATISSISVDTVDNFQVCKVLVEQDQLSLAIGKDGQNARLAAKLTGRKIDIKTKD